MKFFARAGAGSKPERLVTIVLYFIIVTLPCLTLISCFGTSPPDGYLSTDANSVSFIQFTEKDNQLSGHIQGVTKTDDIPPQTKSFTTAITGTQNGSSVTITTSIFGLSSSVTGTLNGDTLTLEVPQPDGHLQNTMFNGASTQQYNQAIDALQKRVSQQDQRYQEQQAVSDANSQLDSTINTLKNDTSTLSSFSETSTLNDYATRWQNMQKDYAIERKDAQAGCSNSYQVGVDDYQVGVDAYQIGQDDYQLNIDKNTYNTDMLAVQNNVQALQQDWAQLQQAVAHNETRIPAPEYTANDVNNALQSAQNAEKTAGSVWQSAQASASQYDQEASALQKKADALPTSMHCN